MTDSTRNSGATKPRGFSSVDLSHPINKKLISAYLFNDRSGDVIRDSSPRKNNLIATVQGTWRHDGLHRDTGTVAIEQARNITLNGKVTVACRVRRFGELDEYPELWSSNFGISAGKESSPNALTVRYDNRYSTNPGMASIWDEDWHDVFVVIDVDSPGSVVWIDGVENIGNNWISQPDTVTTGKMELDESVTFRSSVIFSYFCVWDRILNPYEIRDLTRDPYRIFKKNIIQIPSPQIAVEGGNENPYSYYAQLQ